MAGTKAAGPKLSLADLIDQHLGLEDELKELENQKKELAGQIAAAMKAKKLKSAMGNREEGYRISSWLQCDFEPEALEYIRRIKKEDLFTPAPSVTKARLRDAFSGGHLTAAQHEKIRSFGGPDYEVSRLYKIRKDADT